MQGAKAPVEKMNPITMVVAQTNLAQMMNVATLPMSMMAVLYLFHHTFLGAMKPQYLLNSNRQDITYLRRFFATLVFLVMSAFSIFSKDIKEHEVQIWGHLVDILTYKPVIDATFTVMTSDSVAVTSGKTSQGDYSDIPRAFVIFNLNKAGKYIIKCEKEGYETTYNDYEIKKIYKNETLLRLNKPFVIKRITKSQKLKGVTVKATKIKFYNRGDTLIYNADAFELEEGSMLDALVQQLPDVELKKGGEIYVRGKKVDELLLNGRDFFNKDRNIILENLPSYMVNQVKVYEREDEILKKSNPDNSKLLSMNIQLKRKYSIGWIANAEAGVGTKDKNLARLFALRFTPQSRFSLFANVNNLNDDRKPGNNGDWTPLQQTTGEKTVYNGGFDYNIYQKGGIYTLSGSLTTNYIEENTNTVTNKENFLSGGNTYGKAFNTQRKYTSSINTYHDFRYLHQIPIKFLKISYLKMAPRFSYYTASHNRFYADATLSEDANKILGSDWKEKLLSHNSSEELRTYGINRIIQEEKGKYHQLSTSADWTCLLDACHNDYIGLYLSGKINYLTARNKRYDHYKLEYFNPSSIDFRNRYDFNKNRTFSNEIDATTPTILILKKPSIRFNLGYSFKYKFQEQNRSLYLLSKLDGWDVDSLHALGDLPSVNEMLQLLDGNSYQQTKTDKNHEIYMQIQHGQTGTDNFKRTNIQFTFIPKIRFEHNKFDYFRTMVIDTTMKRDNVFFEPSFQMSIFPAKGNYWDKWHFSINYNLTHNAPLMVYLTGITDTSNPLSIMQGNKNLKNSSTHHLAANFRKPLSRKRNINMAASANVYTDKVALGYIYEHNTGVRTITPDNINGNWNAAYSVTYRSRLDKKDRWSYQTATGYTYVNSVDLIGTSATADHAVRSKVGSHYITESALLRYAPSSKTDFYLKGNVNYQNAQSDRDNFKTINVYDFNYGLTARIELPLALQLSTDLTMYSRRGYNDPSMNTNDLVWNARISKRFMHGNLVCMLDAFDLLGNLSNVRRTIDAQGRVETWTNVTPQFALLHVIYRLNKQPKKK